MSENNRHSEVLVECMFYIFVQCFLIARCAWMVDTFLSDCTLSVFFCPLQHHTETASNIDIELTSAGSLPHVLDAQPFISVTTVLPPPPLPPLTCPSCGIEHEVTIFYLSDLEEEKTSYFWRWKQNHRHWKKPRNSLRNLSWSFQWSPHIEIWLSIHLCAEAEKVNSSRCSGFLLHFSPILLSFPLIPHARETLIISPQLWIFQAPPPFFF